MWNVPPSPESGHLTSMILMTPGGKTATGRSPLVSISTVYPADSSRSARGTVSGCNRGSPPVSSTSDVRGNDVAGNDEPGCEVCGAGDCSGSDPAAGGRG